MSTAASIVIIMAALVLRIGDVQEVATHSLPDSDQSVTRLLYDSAKRCWSAPASLWSLGFEVENRVELDGFVIEAWSVRHPQIRLKRLVKINVSAQEEGQGSRASISEARVGKRDWQFSKDVDRWLAGDPSCHPAKHAY